ncbi:hypothetical protein NLX86_18990 [Streptomyces sp. A3M-1-3]|uniref:hypothetical protein n=1 Tax=Streptomyces sp. A3M-1-3 TaxID=2962044 RepID=UPI0020B88B5D|nr:hypothetical protein [Streptomyces sp. A3M-1-3]MCP3820105.1 hypothetical protein [Streptomyces sp. A3M-1-3]
MTTSIRPTDLPELRAELMEHYQKPNIVDSWARRRAPAALEFRDANGMLMAKVNPTGDTRRLLEIGRLEKAELFFVSAAMTDVAVAAAATLPSFAVEEFDLPSSAGLMIFEKPIAADANTEGGYGETVYIAGASWNIIRNQKAGTLLWLSFYIDLHQTLDGEVAAGGITEAQAAREKSCQPRYSYTTDGAKLLSVKSELNGNSVLNLWGRTIVAAWLLSQQPLADVSEVEADRAAAKRLKRARHEARPVRVVELRRPSSGGGQGEPVSNYQHQWIVRGHWRNQWHPKREVHRPVWIAPHVKGPEGAPLLGGEKVYAWKR